MTVEIDGSRFEQNANAGANFSDNVSGVVSGSSFSKNTDGAHADPLTSGATNKMTFRNCVFSSNSSVGLIAGGFSGTTTQMLVTDSEISYNLNTGLQAVIPSTVTMSNATVTHNLFGINGITIRSFQDNRLYGNTTDGSFTATIGKL